MRYEITQTSDTSEQITQSVTQCVHRMQQTRQQDAAAHDDFATARGMLETMLLPTSFVVVALGLTAPLYRGVLISAIRPG